MSQAPRKPPNPVGLLFTTSLILFALRMHASSVIGFGDSEALYASWALHPQAAYLDHPGLVGLVMRWIGSGGAPSPAIVHTVTAFVATAVPGLAFVAGRAAGANVRASAWAALTIALVPEVAVGLFGMTPDLLLAVLWVGSLACAAYGLRSDADGSRAAASLVGAGLLAGIACTAKVSGALLVVALLVAYAGRAARPHAKTVWPWAGILLGLIPLAPVVSFEAENGWPMLRHRLVDAQAAGWSAGHAAGVLAGQFAYVSPVLAVLAFAALPRAFRTLVERPAEEPVSAEARLFASAFVVPLFGLLPLALWSRGAEPHWIAPAFLAVPFARAVRVTEKPELSFFATPRLGIAALVPAALMTLLCNAWVLVPDAMRLWPQSAPPRANIARELFGWPDAISAVHRTIESVMPPDAPLANVVVVGPHWTICSQLHAALGPSVLVGCMTPTRDDFDDWLPRELWAHADTLILVRDAHDERSDIDVARDFPTHVLSGRTRVSVTRGGRVLRVFVIDLLEPRALGSR